MHPWCIPDAPWCIPDAPLMHLWCNRTAKIEDRRSKSEITDQNRRSKVIEHKSKVTDLDRNKVFIRKNIYSQIENQHQNRVSIRKRLYSKIKHRDRTQRLHSKKSLFEKISLSTPKSQTPGYSNKMFNARYRVIDENNYSRLHDVCRQIANSITPGSSHPLKWN